MKRHKRKQNSLVLFCALHFLVYTLLLVGVYGLFQYLVNERMNAAFFSIDDLLQYQEALEREDYGAIPAKNVSFLIFDDEGHTVYASNRTIGEKVFFEDLDMLDDYHSGKLLDVFQSQTADGSVEYTVYLSTYAEAGKAPKLLSSCVLDEDYNILRGDLFAGRQALTQREFNLLCGISKTNSMAEKYTYETTTGEGRTLVFFATRMGEREYDQSLRWTNSLWLAGVPCILLVVLGCILSFPWRMKKRIHPLSQAIEAYGQGKAAEISQEDIPSEFDETVVSFRRLLDQLDQARREKERVYQEKQALIADISHDLRTPLTVIQGYTEALEEGKVPPEKVGQYRKAILTKSRLATDLVSDLFLFTQMEHPDYPMQGETANFGAFVRTFFAEKYLDLTEQGFCLQADLPDPPVPLWFDAKLMRRLLENLLGNTMKHNPRGTTLYVVLTQTEEAVRLTIADDGVGISPDLAATLFQPFVTGNHARTTGKGTGLGLSIAQRIVEMHRGKIAAVFPPTPPYHTEFVITLPAGPERPKDPGR